MNTVTTLKGGRKKELIQAIYECSISLNTLSLKCHGYICKFVHNNIRQNFDEKQDICMVLSVSHR